MSPKPNVTSSSGGASAAPSLSARKASTAAPPGARKAAATTSSSAPAAPPSSTRKASVAAGPAGGKKSVTAPSADRNPAAQSTPGDKAPQPKKIQTTTTSSDVAATPVPVDYYKYLRRLAATGTKELPLILSLAISATRMNVPCSVIRARLVQHHVNLAESKALCFSGIRTEEAPAFLVSFHAGLSTAITMASSDNSSAEFLRNITFTEEESLSIPRRYTCVLLAEDVDGFVLPPLPVGALVDVPKSMPPPPARDGPDLLPERPAGSHRSLSSRKAPSAPSQKTSAEGSAVATGTPTTGSKGKSKAATGTPPPSKSAKPPKRTPKSRAVIESSDEMSAPGFKAQAERIAQSEFLLNRMTDMYSSMLEEHYYLTLCFLQQVVDAQAELDTTAFSERFAGTTEEERFELVETILRIAMAQQIAPGEKIARGRVWNYYDPNVLDSPVPGHGSAYLFYTALSQRKLNEPKGFFLLPTDNSAGLPAGWQPLLDTEFIVTTKDDVEIPLGILPDEVCKRLVRQAVADGAEVDPADLELDTKHAFYRRLEPGFHHILAHPEEYRLNIPAVFLGLAAAERSHFTVDDAEGGVEGTEPSNEDKGDEGAEIPAADSPMEVDPSPPPTVSDPHLLFDDEPEWDGVGDYSPSGYRVLRGGRQECGTARVRDVW
ncbi:hypothetical protein MVEN_01732100 [Mycena venus]|uniref:Uncharacterized protein n=1 Tax=Mycena venus TaxID=2733690 RepID=A0A8H6XLW5_9AGAR|nr:hypothetical protein MVEN_01732100 [Mycena venus]